MSAGAAAAAAAAAEQRAEEEEMTSYSSKDLAEGWEFKILRSATGGFRDSLWLHAILEEEARAGWSLVEKFDNARVRLKRPASARANDRGLGFDPYRTFVGIGPGRFGMILVVAIIAGVGAILLIAALIIGLTGHAGR